MPRRRLPPRLYLDKARQQWAILDGTNFVRTGCAHDELAKAERVLAEYIGLKYQPQRSPAPPIADILLAYLRDKVPTMKSRSTKYYVSNLAAWWSDKTLADVTAANCRTYAKNKTQSAARADLERLAAAIQYWHEEYGPLDKVPVVWKPQRVEARDRWLTRSEAARFLWETRRTEHLKRFTLIGLYTGSRSGAIRNLEWSWIDLERGTMRRRAPGTSESKNERTPPIPIPRKLLHFLRRWHRIDGGKAKYVVHYNGAQIKRDVQTAWRNARKRAGMPWLHPHVLRHTRATWMVQKGVAPWQAAGYLGMTVRVLEATYGHHSPDYMREAADI